MKLYFAYAGNADYENNVLPKFILDEEEVINIHPFVNNKMYEIEHYYMTNELCSTNIFTDNDLNKVRELKYGKLYISDNKNVAFAWLEKEIDVVKKEVQNKLEFYKKASEVEDIEFGFN